MKEFEKWWGNFDCSIIDCKGIGCNDVCKEIRKETWRVALKEILKQLNIIYSGDFENSDIVKWIKQELGDI